MKIYYEDKINIKDNQRLTLLTLKLISSLALVLFPICILWFRYWSSLFSSKLGLKLILDILYDGIALVWRTELGPLIELLFFILFVFISEFGDCMGERLLLPSIYWTGIVIGIDWTMGPIGKCWIFVTGVGK